MSCDLRVLKRFTPVTQGEKTHFPKKNQGFCRLSGSGNFLLQGSSRHKSGRNERGGADRPRPRTASQVLSHRPSETPSTKVQAPEKFQISKHQTAKTDAWTNNAQAGL